MHVINHTIDAVPEIYLFCGNLIYFAEQFQTCLRNSARILGYISICVYIDAMDTASLKQRLERKPFLPFRIHLVDGRSFDILRPDWTLVIPPFRRVFIARPQLGQGRFCPIEEIDVMFITSLEELPPAQENDSAAA